MTESNTTYFIKQVWRQKGDEQFDRIPFKEENKAQELSQTKNPVLLLETKTNGGAGAVFAVGRVTESVVVEEAVSYTGQNGEFTYHVPFAYDVILSNKKDGVTREELQEIAGQKFAPQAKGGLYEIDANVYAQVVALLNERTGGESAPVAVEAVAEVAPVVVEAVETTVEATEVVATEQPAAPAIVADSALADALQQAGSKLGEQPELRAVIEDGKVSFYPVTLLAAASDLVELQTVITEYVAAGGNAEIEAAAQEAAATAAVTGPHFANLIGLVEQLVREGRYESVQVPTAQKAFYRAGNLPSPYLAVELQGKQGHHVLGIDGTLYTTEGKTVQHFLGL